MPVRAASDGSDGQTETSVEMGVQQDNETQAYPTAAVANGGPRAIARVLRLFDLLARTGQDQQGQDHQAQGMTLSELSHALDVAKSTLLSSLRALVSDGFLITDGSTYCLGPCAYRMAGNIMSSWARSDIVRHFVRKLAAETGESVGFAIADWEIGQTFYTEALNSNQSVHYAMRVGLRAPLYASAAGRVLLAYAQPDQRDDYMARTAFRALTPSTRTTPDSILENLRLVRDQGYCASFGEMLKDTAAIAVPVFNPSGSVTGALMVAVPIERMRSHYDQLLAQVTLAGQQASGDAKALMLVTATEKPAKASLAKRRKKPVDPAEIFAAFLSDHP